VQHRGFPGQAAQLARFVQQRLIQYQGRSHLHEYGLPMQIDQAVLRAAFSGKRCASTLGGIRSVGGVTVTIG